MGESGDVPISEMELEWYHGSEEDFKYIASKLAEKYNLKAENISKLRRAFGMNRIIRSSTCIT